ncbi:MAG TPA: DUF4276 family protein [Verrucomicrobiae bacterium]|jgi:hypothetical protein|nr:DUF4276 family protein [Verrucomicrobiae bacterium]
MGRILVHVEGETEEQFVNEVLSSHLLGLGLNVSVRIVGNARLRERRGGIKGWNEVRRDITRHLKQDTSCHATTMVDYYALPKAGEKAWPGRTHAPNLPFEQRAPHVETQMEADVRNEMGNDFFPVRFIPFVIMHEFEALLFSDCAAFSRGIGRPDLQQQFQAIRDIFATPEEINDSPITAPSKRVLQIIPTYQKPFLGPLAALEIGLERMRQECPHFDAWLTRLEQVPP